MLSQTTIFTGSPAMCFLTVLTSPPCNRRFDRIVNQRAVHGKGWAPKPACRKRAHCASVTRCENVPVLERSVSHDAFARERALEFAWAFELPVASALAGNVADGDRRRAPGG